MSLTVLGLFLLVALIVRFTRRGRDWLLLIVSTLAIFLLQPVTSLPNFDFWLPVLTLTLIALTYATNRADNWRDDLITLSVIVGIVLILSALRYANLTITPATPPDVWWVALTLGGAALGAVAVAKLAPNNARVSTIFFIGFIVLLVVIKTEPFARTLSLGWRSLLGRDVSLATATEVQWLGFSYVAFRLMHTLRERANPRFPKLTLREYFNYVIFFPAFMAGPIDRADRFVKDARASLAETAPDVVEGGRRVAVGVLKKFIFADTLAIIALNAQNATQVSNPFWLWLLVYAYAWRIYFDFSGYTDIAVGVGRVLGFKLPENFDAPYFKTDLTTFWNSWHMTLSQWFRAYFFNPLTRALRSRSWSMPVIIFLGQFGTMLLIGLWHGVTWNFVVWGVWHGVGLFAHNRYLEFMKPRLVFLDERPNLKRFTDVLGSIITFHYVALGWVWFALPSLDLSLKVLQRLFNFA